MVQGSNLTIHTAWANNEFTPWTKSQSKQIQPRWLPLLEKLVLGNPPLCTYQAALGHRGQSHEGRLSPELYEDQEPTL